jgi:hypothetical protein
MKQGAHKAPRFLSFKTMPETISIIATSKKGKSRIGTKLTMGIVEQNHCDKLFVVFPELNQCRWIKKDNDPDFRIIGDD